MKNGMRAITRQIRLKEWTGVFRDRAESGMLVKDYCDAHGITKDTICQGSYVDADIDIEDETHIVTLSTCSYDSDVRFTVSAVRVDEHEWSP
jgi:hypothetical protein